MVTYSSAVLPPKKKQEIHRGVRQAAPASASARRHKKKARSSARGVPDAPPLPSGDLRGVVMNRAREAQTQPTRPRANSGAGTCKWAHRTAPPPATGTRAHSGTLHGDGAQAGVATAKHHPRHVAARTRTATGGPPSKLGQPGPRKRDPTQSPDPKTPRKRGEREPSAKGPCAPGRTPRTVPPSVRLHTQPKTGTRNM